MHDALRLLLGGALALLPVLAVAAPSDDARRHFRSGLEAAAEGEYEVAVAEFLLAWTAIPHPSTAFNIARGYEDLGRPADALVWYERFEQIAPDRRAEVDEPLRRVRAALGLDAVRGTSAGGADASLARLKALDAEREVLVRALAAQGVEVGTPEAPAAPPPAPAETAPAAAPVAPAAPAEPGAAREGLLTDAYDQVVVTASRYGQDPLDSPSAVTVLTGDDLRHSGAVNLADALRRAVGVDVMAMSQGVPYLGIRAFNGEMTNKVLWLVDGRPTSLEFLATPMPVSIPIGLDDIERIEIIRGPGSAIYGANAVTGVVNIITRLPGTGPRFVASMGGGANQLLLGSLTASGTVGRVAYRASAGYQQEGRFEKDAEVLPETAVPFRTDQDLGEQRYRGALRLDTTFGTKGWASLSGGFGTGFTEFYAKGALGNNGLDGGVGHVRADVGWGPVHLRSTWQREGGRVTPWLSSAASSRSTEANVLDDIVDLELEGSFRKVTGAVEHRIHVGGGYKYKVFRAGVIGQGFEIPRIEHHASLFGQYQLQWRWLGAVASLRWDRHPLIDATRTFAPRGALVFRVRDTTALRVSAGTAYRAINGLESYVNLDLNTTADGYFVGFRGAATGSSVTLGPENMTTVELGARDESSPFHKIDLAVYWNRLTDLIDIGSVEPVLGPYDPDAGGYPFGQAEWVNDPTAYDAIGGEVDLTLFPVDGLDLFVNGSVQRVLATSDGVTTVDGSTALARVNVGGTYRAPFRMDFSLSAHVTTAQDWRVPQFDDTGTVEVVTRPIPGRVLMVARIAGRPVTKPELELSATLWNPLGFFDETAFREHPDGQVVGPRLYGQARIAF